MPATEQTWRNQTLLHLVFGASAVVMLVSTIWMFAKDHYREWKLHQQTTNQIEQFYTRARISETATRQFNQRLEQAEQDLAAARSAPLDEELISEVRQAAAEGAEQFGLEPIDFTGLDAQLQQLQTLAQQAEAARALARQAEAEVERLLAAAQDAEAAGNAEEAATARSDAEAAIADSQQKQAAANEATNNAIAARGEILTQLRKPLEEAEFLEDSLAGQLKFRKADHTAKLSERDLAVHHGSPAEVVDRLQAEVDAIAEDVGQLQSRLDVVTTYRKRLNALINGRENSLNAQVVAAERAVEEQRRELSRLHESLEGPMQKVGRTVLGMPIIDAFNNTDLQIEQLWLPDVTIDYNFSDVARFDRCISCHRNIDRTRAGMATEPRYEVAGDPFTVTLATPDRQPQPTLDENGELQLPTVKSVYGLVLAEEGLLDADDVVVQGVLPRSAAADAGLRIGDTIFKIGTARLRNREHALTILLQTALWGEPLKLTIERGLPNPYASHPRLDLYLTSLSPHKMGEIGCTICHEGQGSATAFKWASHTPNDPHEAMRWRREYGWFDNHHWIFPMNPERFIESGCLKCHHEVTELEPSARFPDPPAPKLTDGYDLVRTYGCYGCHEIKGYDGPDQRVGPDLRVEPNYYAFAAQFRYLIEPQLEALSSTETELAKRQEVVDARLAKLQPAPAPPKEPQGGQQPAAEEKEEAAGSEQDDQAAAPPGPAPSEAEIQILQAQKSLIASGLAAVRLALDPLSQLDRLARSVAEHPEDDESRRELQNLIEIEAEKQGELPTKAAAGIRQAVFDALDAVQGKSAEEAEAPLGAAAESFEDLAMAVLPKAAAEMSDDFGDVETPGAFRKVGPSLRHLASKVDADWLYAWIKKPADFRPTTRMPQFFGLWDHLAEGSPGRQASQRFEPIEILSSSYYLMSASQPFETLEFEPGSAQRGKELFRTRGCLACHSHKDFPGIQQTHGPDLSRVGEKLGSAKGRRWLYTWLRQPNHYNPRTKMPNVFLEPIRDEQGNLTDPAADIVEYLAPADGTSAEGWRPKLLDRVRDGAPREALYDLALEHLSGQYPAHVAARYLDEGIPASAAEQIVGDEIALVGMTEENRLAKQVAYVGRRTISKFGCFGCHDIPGYEGAKPIGTGLADWGRKEPSKLAFEQITQFLQMHGGHGGDHHHEPGVDHGLSERDRESADVGFFLEAIDGHHRSGFLWQKLRQPRSYDYKKTENKNYNDRLRMPRFPFTAEEREAVMTFVLGLVAEPPAEKFLYRPGPQQQSLVQGRQVLQKYNCGGCHTLEMERWEFDYHPDDFRPPITRPDYPFLEEQLTPQQKQASLETDRRGLRHAVVHGRPLADPESGQPLLLNEDLEMLEPGDDQAGYYHFQLWRPAVINGQLREVGAQNLEIRDDRITQYPAWGGALANYLLPHVLPEEVEKIPNILTRVTKAEESWSWLPPPLVDEGEKVQTAWLHDFLLDPYPIRPAVVLRMPKFNMSSGEATKLAAYFAAADNAEHPYEFDPRTRESRLGQIEATRPDHLAGALKIIVDNNYCVKCHLVGDYSPGGKVTALAPQLDDVHRRLRPEYLRRWIANPRKIQPYTVMPVNIPYGKPVSQELYPGDSTAQIDAVVDLLMNYDIYAERQVSIKPMVKPPAQPEQTTRNDNADRAGGTQPTSGAQ